MTFSHLQVHENECQKATEDYCNVKEHPTTAVLVLRTPPRERRKDRTSRGAHGSSVAWSQTRKDGKALPKRHHCHRRGGAWCAGEVFDGESRVVASEEPLQFFCCAPLRPRCCFLPRRPSQSPALVWSLRVVVEEPQRITKKLLKGGSRRFDSTCKMTSYGYHSSCRLFPLSSSCDAIKRAARATFLPSCRQPI